MNIPNKLTIFRVILAPALLAVMLLKFQHNMAVALAIFIVASITDFLDGQLARRNNMVTTFGKFLDPIADKLLVFAAMMGLAARFCVKGIAWVIFIMITRELLVASARMLAAADGNVISADIWGKLKTVAQMVAVVAVITFEELKTIFELTKSVTDTFYLVGTILMWITAVLTIFSGINYLMACRRYIMKSK